MAENNQALSLWFNNLPLAAPTTHACDKCFKDVRSDEWDAKRFHFTGECMARIDLDAEFGRMREYKSPTVSSGVGETATGLQQDAQMADMIREHDPFQAVEPTEICPNCGEMTTLHYGHCNKCERYVRDDTAASGVQLSLLVIDLGDSCVVKVEKGDDIDDISIGEATASRLICCRTGLIQLYDFAFTDIRAAIDALGEKPLPRIERGVDNVAGRIMHIITGNSDEDDAVREPVFNALCELAGVTLPVWTGGEWVQLLPRREEGEIGGEYSEVSYPDIPFKAWRYTRR